MNPLKEDQILIIDDTPLSLQILSRFLTNKGYQIITANTGKEGIATAEVKLPDLILLDITMPDLDGFTVCQYLKEHQQTAKIPIIVISALDDIKDKIKAFDMGAVDYIAKPFQYKEVLARVENQLSIHHLQKQLTEQNLRLQQEIKERIFAEEALQKSTQQLRQYNQVLINLAKNPVIHQGELKIALTFLTEAIAKTLNIQRVSVWFYDPLKTKIECWDLFELVENRHTAGIELFVTDYPGYFNALSQEELIVANDAHTDPNTCEFSQGYLTPLGISSMLDAPIRFRGEIFGVLCLEWMGLMRNWTMEEQTFASSISDLISLALEAKERKQTEEALRLSELREREKTIELTQTIQQLKKTQAQLIQTEKMSSLGQLIAGIAHEINNPINFIYGNIQHADNYLKDLLNLVQLYQETYPNPEAIIAETIEEIELDFLIDDLQKIFNSMQVGSDRIRQIVLSLRNFSRLDEAELKPVDIHEGIDNTILILQHRLKAKDDKPKIQVIKNYGNLPKVTCYSSQLNQVFMNLLSNAIDALDAAITKQKDSNYQPQITIQTEINDYVIIKIIDNGLGMDEATKNKIFDPFFTTKPVGKGTGLGLSISYQIIVEQHQGKLICNSNHNQGTEFIIKLPLK